MGQEGRGWVKILEPSSTTWEFSTSMIGVYSP